MTNSCSKMFKTYVQPLCKVYYSNFILFSFLGKTFCIWIINLDDKPMLPGKLDANNFNAITQWDQKCIKSFVFHWKISRYLWNLDKGPMNKMERNLKSTTFQGAVQEIATICNERQFETAVLSSMWHTHGHRHIWFLGNDCRRNTVV